MKNLLIKLFIKDPDNTRDPAVRESYGSLAGTVGIVSNLILCSFKIITGVIFGSIAVLADGINNLSDAASSLITLLGFKIAGKPADKDHPYGHGRSEYMAGLVVSVMVEAIGISLLKSSIEKTLHPEPVDFSTLTIAVLVVAILIKLWQTGFNVSIGKLISSDALLATAADSRNDVISTSAVLLSTVIGKFTGYNPDGPVGILVALFIIRAGWELLKEGISPIIGQAPDPQIVAELRREITKHPCCLGVHDLIIHDYGPGRMFASVHVEVDADKDIMATHDEVDNIETEVYEKMGIILTCHMDPLLLNDPLTETVKSQIKEIMESIPDILSFHDVRVVPGPTHINVVFDVVLAFDSKMTPHDCKVKLAEELVKFNPLYKTVVTVDRAMS